MRELKLNLKIGLIIFIMMSAFLTATAKISGSYHGSLGAGNGANVPIGLNFSEDKDGNYDVTLDSPAQGAVGIKGEVAYISEDSVAVTFPHLYLSYQANLKGDKLIGTLTQRAMIFDLDFEPGKVELPRPQTPKPPFPYDITEVEIINAGYPEQPLGATLTTPKDTGAGTKAVVLVSGSGIQNRDEEFAGHKPFAVIADYLTRHGIAVLRYDDRGYGLEANEIPEITLSSNKSDALCAVKFLRDKGFDKVGLIGHSEGGLIGEMIASEIIEGKSLLDFFVGLGAPGVRGDSILVYQNSQLLRPPYIPEGIAKEYIVALTDVFDRVRGGENPKEIGEKETYLIAGWPKFDPYKKLKENLKLVCLSFNPWLKEFISVSPSSFIGKIEIPTLMLYGSKDTQVPPELNVTEQMRTNPALKIEIIPGKNHLFQPCRTGEAAEYSAIPITIDDGVLAIIADFIASVN